MRKLILLIIAFLLLPQLAAAYDVLILQGQRSKSHTDAVNGFFSVCNASSRLLVLADYAELDLARIVREDRPRVVVTVGDRALEAAKKLRKTPIVSILSVNLHRTDRSRRNLTGVDVFVPPERYEDVFSALKTKRVGILYDPSKTGWYVRRALGVFNGSAELVHREVRNPKESINIIQDLRNKVDALWVIPDNTAIVPQSAEAFFAFSHEQLVPVISFSETHLGYGAAAVLEIDRTELGKQAAEIALSILGGESPSGIPLASPRKARVKTNPSVLSRLGFSSETSKKLTP